MNKIKVNQFLSAGLNSQFCQIQSIAIPDKAFNSGGFGEVYISEKINGNSIAQKQVIKIFFDMGNGSALKSYNTIQKLQKKVLEKDKELRQKGQPGITQIPALDALPQFSFKGQLKGKTVYGYAANLLPNTAVEFSQVLEDPNIRQQYQQLSIKDKIVLAAQLSEGFKLLKEMSFIHADLNPENFFVDLQHKRLAIIDYDSGAVTAHQHDKPSTFGKLNDWIAPEILAQLQNSQVANPSVKVDLYTDTWSVAIGVHYLLFLTHPLFYLKAINQKNLQDYFGQFEWPNINPNSALFNQHNSPAILQKYQDLLQSKVPKEIVNRLANTINKGMLKANMRTSYDQWLMALKASQNPPKFTELKTSKMYMVEGDSIELKWNIAHADEVIISPNIGAVKNAGKMNASLKDDAWIRVIGKNPFGEVEKKIFIKVLKYPKTKLKQFDETVVKFEIPILDLMKEMNLTKKVI